MLNCIGDCLKNVIKTLIFLQNIFERYFKPVNNPDDDVLYFIERYEKDEFSIMFDEIKITFSYEELLNAIEQLNTNKRSGPDLHPNEFSIYGKNVLSSYL